MHEDAKGIDFLSLFTDPLGKKAIDDVKFCIMEKECGVTRLRKTVNTSSKD